MRRAIRVPLAVTVGLLLVVSSMFGAVMLHPNVDDLDDAATHAGFGAAEGASFWSVVDKMAATAGGLSIASLWDDSSVNKSELDQLDATETKKELHALAGTQDQNNDNLMTAYGNYLEDTETIATIEGKNAYIKALNNGASESEARSQARQAVSAYYATKQKNIVSAWNTSAIGINNSEVVEDDTTGIDDPYIRMNASGGDGIEEWADPTNQTVVKNVTLVNSSTHNIVAIEAKGYNKFDDGSGNIYHFYGTDTVHFLDNDIYVTSGSYTSENKNIYVENAFVAAPNSNFEDLRYTDFSRFEQRWSEIETQNSQVQAELDTFINNTYDSYVTGQINETDLVDPYLGAREYGPDSGFQTWALSSVLSLGLDGPENLSNVGKMVVTDHNANLEYEGIVLTDENPDGGLTVGSTYNASELNGTQMVVTSSTTRELTGEFTLENATTSDGTEYAVNESVTYKTVNYNTTNTTEYQNLMAELTALQEELNERQQQERSGAGGGLNSGTKMALALVAAIVGAAALVGRN